MRLAVRLAGIVLSALVAFGGRAACAQTPFAGTTLSRGATASVWTVRPGTAVYSRFGHTAIRVRDDTAGLDVLYNYGTFRFDNTFLFRFAYGAMDYELSAAPALAALDGYDAFEDRAVVEQRLNLPPDRVQALFDALETNLRPEHATYRYDFLFDNCATRPRDVIARVLGPDVAWPADRPSGATFRELIRLYARDAPGLRLAMDLGIGTLVDRTATFRDATFLPDTLLAYLDAARLRTPDGRLVPLVAETRTLVAKPPRPAPATFDWPLALAWALFAGVAAVSLRDARAGRTRRRGLDVALFGAAGLAGLVLAFLAFVSVHRVTAPNATLLWASPLLLVLVGRSTVRWVRAVAALAAVLALAGAAAGALGVQDIPAASIPLALAVAVRATVRAWPPRARA